MPFVPSSVLVINSDGLQPVSFYLKVHLPQPLPIGFRLGNVYGVWKLRESTKILIVEENTSVGITSQLRKEYVLHECV